MSEEQLSIPYSELGRLELRCPKCGSGFVLDLSSTNLPPLGGERDFARQCPVCRTVFPDQALGALILYQRFQTEARKGNLDIRFRLKIT
jgi:hypothetical protein